MRVWIVGDSHANFEQAPRMMWPADWDVRFDAYPGLRCVEIRAQLADMDEKFALAVVIAGTNDRTLAVEHVAREMSMLADEVGRHARHVWLAVPWYDGLRWQTALDQELFLFHGELRTVLFVPNKTEELAGDSVHLNERGQCEFAKEIVREVLKWMSGH